MPTLLPYTYFGPIHYYQQLAEETDIVFEKHENFIKQTYRNRCSIYGPNGELNLVVPTIHISGERSINLRRISYEQDWRKLHWKSLEAAYRSSPFFEYYEDDIQPILMKKYDLLVDLNTSLMQWACKALEIELEIKETVSYEEDFDGHDLRQAYDPKTLSVKEGSFKRYPQVFEDRCGFIPNLSILDLIFNQGPNSAEYL